jgi:hypothetical protein
MGVGGIFTSILILRGTSLSHFLSLYPLGDRVRIPEEIATALIAVNMKCKKCKKPLTAPVEHKCERCEFRLCRSCDDRTDFLDWVEIHEDQPDQYLCYKCRATLQGKHTLQERVAEECKSSDAAPTTRS